jgi:tRNA(Ile)-lysidine synthase
VQDIAVGPGRYVLAVSGGVDSMVLLNLLQDRPGIHLTVAHFDHGIREDSVADRRLVEQAAKFYGLPFVYHEGRLGERGSEATARQARYEFLRTVQKAAGAQAIITAHHQDDVLETAILNVLRGTGRKGLSSLANRLDVQRPLLHVPKVDIIKHAQQYDLVWREDSTNQDQVYARNYVRGQIMPRVTGDGRARLAEILSESRRINAELDQELIHQLHQQQYGGTIDKRWFAGLPHDVAREVMATWLREHGLATFDRATLERLVVKAKTQACGRRVNVLQNHWLDIKSDHLALSRYKV